MEKYTPLAVIKKFFFYTFTGLIDSSTTNHILYVFYITSMSDERPEKHQRHSCIIKHSQ